MLLRNEISIGFGGSASAKHRKHRDRSLDVRSCVVNIQHIPTGVIVTGEIEAGHYNKKKMRQLRNEMIEKLLLELEQAVA